VRVVVAEDSLLTREGIVHVLSRSGTEVVGQVGDGEALLRAVALERPDVAVVDVRMPPTHTTEGITAARRILAERPGTAVLVLSQYIEPGYALTLLEERPDGVGYLLKERISDAAVLMDALHRLTDGESVIDPTIVKALMARSRRPTGLEVLTDRELEVLALVAEGLSNRAVGDRLSITERTVEAHITRILPKLGLADGPDVHRRVLAALAFVEGTREG
jgi:DNA-binding NarL/FixJ family response regulator